MSRRPGSVENIWRIIRIAPTPSNIEWWNFTYTAKRASGVPSSPASPSMRWTSQSGRWRSSSVEWNRLTSTNSSRTRPGRGSAENRRW